MLAPRGEIVDRDGEVLVDNRTSLALQVNPRKLPADPSERRAELARLAELTDTTLAKVRRTMHEELEVEHGAPVTLRRDVGHYLVYYLQENQGDFPGVEVRARLRARYPPGTLAAHLFGNVGEVSEEELKEARYREPRARRRDRQGRGRVRVRPLPARTRRRDPDPGRLARQADPQRPAEAWSSRSPATTCG